MVMPKTQDETSLLKNLVPLNTLSDQQLAQLVSQVSIEQAKKGTYLFRQGDTDNENFYLLSGKVALISGSREVDLVKSGSNTARFPLAHKLPREYSVQAKSAVSFVCIDNRKLSALLAQSDPDAYEVNEINSGGSSDWMTQILQSPVFQQIPAANIQGVMRLMEEIGVNRGDIVIRQGDDGDYYYLISQGQCSVSREHNGVMEEVARLGPGESFGEDALISDRPRSSTITMLTEGRLVRLSKQHFVDLVKRPLSHSLSYEEAAEQVEKGAIWLDVRTAEAHEAAHLRDSINLPLNSLRFQAESLAPDRDYVVYSDLPGESAVADFLLTQRGFSVSMIDVDMASLPVDALTSGKKLKGETGKIVDFTPDETDSSHSRKEVDLAEQLAGRTREAERLAKELKDSQAQHHDVLRQRINELERLKQAFDQAKSKADGLEQERAELLQQQDQLLEDVSQLREANNTAQTELAEKGQEHTLALQEYEEKITELATKQAEESEHLKSEVAQRGATLAAERVAKIEIEHQLHEVESRLQEPQTLIGQLEDEVRQARQDQQTSDHAAASKIAELEKALELSRQEVESIREAHAKTSAQLEHVTGALNESEKGQQSLAAEISAKELELQEHKKRFDQLQFDLESIGQAKVREEEEYRQQLEQALDHAEEEKNRQIHVSEEARNSLQQELEVSRAELNKALAAVADAAQGDLKAEALAQERERLEQELAKAHKEAAAKADILLSQLEQQEKDLQVMAAEREQMLASCATAEKRVTELESEKLSVTEKHHNLDQVMRGLQQENDKLVDSLEQEETKREQLVTDREALQVELESLREIDRSRLDENNLIANKLEETEAQLAAAEVVQEQLGLVKQQLQATNGELETIQTEQDRLKLELSQVEAERDGLLDQVVHSQETLPATDSKVLRERLTEARRQARESEREKDTAQQEIDRLKQELSELRSVMEEYVEQIQAAQARNEVAESLRAELNLVQQQAADDLSRLRQELEHAQNAATEGGKLVAKEIVEQEIQGLHESLEQKIKVLEDTEQQCSLLETNLQSKAEALSQAQQEKRRVQDQLEEERYLHKEQVTLRRQLEDALYLLQSQIKTQTSRSAGPPAKLIDPEDIHEQQLPRSSWPGILLGSLLMFGIVEGGFLFSGKGELISSFMGDKARITIPALRSELPLEKAPLNVISQPKTMAPVRKTVEPVVSINAKSASTTGTDKRAVTKTGPVVIRDRLSNGRYGPAMVKIQGGRFSMGNRRTTLATSEQPAHEVTVRDFLIGQYEVTFNDYDEFAEVTGRAFPDDMGWGRGKRPVINVNWEDASAYAQWLSEQTGRQYRLLSEAEWEYAAAAGTTSSYWWGYQPSSGYAVCFNCGTQWDNRQTAPVGSLSANPFGLHNTAGNVMEWVSDCRNDNYEFAPEDGSAWLTGDCSQRMARGGGFSKPADRLRTTARAQFEVQAKFEMLGFRLARD